MSIHKITRKEFLKKLWWVLLIPYVMLMALMTRRHNHVSAIQEYRIPYNLPLGISFHNDIVCISEDNKLKFFHSRCTHLGCQINKVVENKLVCPCHGSEFGLDGNPLKGPANKSLKELEYSIDKLTNEYVIKLV